MIGKKKQALHESTKNFLSYEWKSTVKFQFGEELKVCEVLNLQMADNGNLEYLIRPNEITP